MLSKKSLLLSATLSALVLPLTANADLYTTNNTHEYSSARVVGTKNCSGILGESGITIPGQTQHSYPLQVNSLCQFHAPCTAEVIMAKNKADALACNGTVAGQATITNLSNDNVTVNFSTAPYQLVASGSTITISYQ